MSDLFVADITGPFSPIIASESEDARFFERLRQDPSVIGEVYDAYSQALYGFLLKRCGHRETAEDLVSQTFVKLLESLSTLEWRGVSIRAWLYRVASNALIDHFRKATTKRDLPLEEEAWELPGSDDPAWTAQIQLEGAQLCELLKQLSGRDQQVLDLKYFAGLETAEIASVLEVSPNHAAVLVYRALGRLRQLAMRLSPVS